LAVDKAEAYWMITFDVFNILKFELSGGRRVSHVIVEGKRIFTAQVAIKGTVNLW
jgi:hypothetical protein